MKSVATLQFFSPQASYLPFQNGTVHICFPTANAIAFTCKKIIGFYLQSENTHYRFEALVFLKTTVMCSKKRKPIHLIVFNTDKKGYDLITRVRLI